MFSQHAMLRAIGCCGLVALLWSAPAAAWMYDTNNDKIDDRIAAVEAQGLVAAHQGGTLAGRQLFAVFGTQAPFSYGVYVGYDHHPTTADASALSALGATHVHAYESIDYVRAQVSFAQIVQIASLSGVTRIETIPIYYRMNDISTRTLRARDSGGKLFPSVWQHLGVTGKNVVIGIIDTGVNDAPDSVNTGYPGHESLRGKFLGGGSFYAAQPELNTALDGSMNPSDHGAAATEYHATHVAGTAMGTGGPTGVLNGATPGFYAGIAPDAMLVDCKALSDGGTGFGAADAIDWCIHHRNTDWGVPGYKGIQVLNMSLGGSAASDGTDANSAAVNAATRAGIVVCVASGNDGNTHYMPSPAAADLALTVGAFTDQNTIDHGDDIVSDFSNEGPRADDGDSDHLDEMKPNVMGTGAGIMSADGDVSSDGSHYHGLNGTSMATPSVAGVVALVRSANPSLTADQVRQLMMDTAEHRTDHGQQPPSAADSFHVDPNYHPSWGWGQVDAYAAVKEAQNAQTTQMVRFALAPQRGPDGVQVKWWTQREVFLARFQVERAADANGGPGAWTTIATIPVSQAQTQIHRTADRHLYGYTDTDAALNPSATYWYRLRWSDLGGGSHTEPALSVKIADSPVKARVLYAWTHNFSDGDLTTRIGTGTDTSHPVWFRMGEGATVADSMKSMSGITYLGTKEYFFHIDLTADEVGTFLPPSAANPWFLSVREGGYLNTKGVVDSFAVQVFDGAGSTTYRSPQPPTQTVEGQETVFWIPLPPQTTLNHAPVLAPIGGRSIGEGLALGFTVSATDADNNALTYAASGLPAGATFNAGTRTFAWTPGYGTAGSYTVRFRVTDNGFPAAADSEDVTLTVTHRNPGDNTAPHLDPLSDRQAIVGEALTFRVTGRDAENDALTYTASGLPSGATLDANSGLFAWTPLPAQPGFYPVTFAVTDAHGAADSAKVYLVASAREDVPPPLLSCNDQHSAIAGVAEQGIDGVTDHSVAYHPFTVPLGAQSLQATLSWFLPARDLDFYLLDADSNVVTSSASINDPEVISVPSIAPGNYIFEVVGFNNPDTSHYEIATDLCVSTVLDAGRPPKPTLMLAEARPNPSHALTAISFALPEAGAARLRVYDVSGRLVRTLQDGWLPSGQHLRVWDRRTDGGAMASPGLYFYRLEAGGRTLAHKVTMLR